MPLPSAPAPTQNTSSDKGAAHGQALTRTAQLSDTELNKLAFLAQLAINPEQRAAVRQQLTAVIALVDAVTAVDTSAVEPLAHPLDATLRTRPDRVTETIERERFQAIAPEARDGFYLVPRVVD